MFRKDVDSVSEWSEGNVKLCYERQQRIVSDVWPSLKEGGLLIYSTCTYNLHENEENVRWIMDKLGAEIVDLQVDEKWNLTPSLSADSKLAVSRFLPHRTRGEGFFMAVLRKTSEAEEIAILRKKEKKQKTKPAPVPAGLDRLVLQPARYTFQQINGKWRAYPPQVFAFLEQSEGLKILNAGILLGEQKGKDLVVSHALSLSNELNTKAFPLKNVDRQTALNYLRKESIVLPDAPMGYVLLTYEDSPIGFVKNMGNRVNSLLPNEWRIKSSHSPEQNYIWLK
jgi:NOL1/NOP2/fmu family ribosome biogenesis protein